MLDQRSAAGNTEVGQRQNRTMQSRKFLLASLAMIAVILHGSLYPYQFRVPAGAAGPVEALLRK